MFNQTNVKSSVSLKLSTNVLCKDSYVARVPRSNVKLEDILSEISKDYPSLDPFVINHSAELIKKQILKFIKAGKSVNILELGTLYLAPEKTVTNVNPQVEDLPPLTLKFSPSKQILKSIEGISAESFMISNSTPQISEIISLKDGNKEGILYKGFGVRLNGSKLKVAGDFSGIFFVPQKENGDLEEDKSLWIQVDSSYLPHNTQKCIEFNIPQNAETEKSYYIAVRTSFITTTTFRKESLTGISLISVKIAES